VCDADGARAARSIINPGESLMSTPLDAEFLTVEFLGRLHELST
jgi:hypothetical protein